MTSSFTPTAEQEAIVLAATTTEDNLIVNARAGAAKTTTIEMIAHSLPDISILAIAFNKKIADTLAERLPPNCESKTLNAIGHAMWRDFCGKFIKVNYRKSYFILKEQIDELPAEERGDVYELMSEILEGVRVAKSVGYLPAGVHSRAKPLMDADEFYSDALEFHPTEEHRTFIDRVLKLSFIEAMQGKIDFDDQIYMPTLMSCSFTSRDLTLVDEAQDLSPINHVLLTKIVKKKRLICVGDPCQAVYGFRGASERSMAELRERFDMHEHYLTICFRSAESIVRNVHWRAPDMAWREAAPEGIVRRLDKWSSADVQDGDAIVCRNNAPLFRMAFELLRCGRTPELASADLGKQLLGVMKKLGKPANKRAQALYALAEWAEAEGKKRKDSGKLSDTVDCIRLFLEETETLGQASDLLEEVMNRPGRIKLLTGHKSKGLEFDRVFFLDRFLIDRKQGQDANIEYVIATRARNALFYVETNNWEK